MTETITHEQATKTHPHGFHQCQGHRKNRVNVPKYYTTTDTHWHTISAQNQHARQPGRHTHNVCHSRSLQQTPLQCWAFELKQQLTFSSTTVSQATFTSMLTSTPTKALATAR